MVGTDAGATRLTARAGLLAAAAGLAALGLAVAVLVTTGLGGLGGLAPGTGEGPGTEARTYAAPWMIAPETEPRAPRRDRGGLDTVEEASFAPAQPGNPDRLRIPALGVDAPVLAIRAPGRVLTPPRDPGALGWWADGAAPGAATGSALFAGHTVHSGGGALDDLETVPRGSEVRVVLGGRSVAYEVTSVVVLGKQRIAAEAGQLFNQDGPGRLVILTCEDWDGTGYRSNVVVVAEPAASGS